MHMSEVPPPEIPRAAKGPLPRAPSEQETNLGLEEDRKGIERLEEPLLKILEELRPQIDNGAYGIIIGDDASGRLPAVIMSDVVDAIYRKDGKKSPIVRFIAGARNLMGHSLGSEDARAKKHAFDLQIERMISDAGLSDSPEQETRVLIVTDYVVNGISSRFLNGGLYLKKLPADIATIALGSNTKLKYLNYTDGTTLVSGGIIGAPSIYGKRDMSGIVKQGKQLFSESTRKVFGKTHPDLEPADLEARMRVMQQRVNAARGVAREVASRLVEAYFSERQQDSQRS